MKIGKLEKQILFTIYAHVWQIKKAELLMEIYGLQPSRTRIAKQGIYFSDPTKTASARASLSRTLKKMKEKGLIQTWSGENNTHTIMIMYSDFRDMVIELLKRAGLFDEYKARFDNHNMVYGSRAIDQPYYDERGMHRKILDS